MSNCIYKLVIQLLERNWGLARYGVVYFYVRPCSTPPPPTPRARRSCTLWRRPSCDGYRLCPGDQREQPRLPTGYLQPFLTRHQELWDEVELMLSQLMKPKVKSFSAYWRWFWKNLEENDIRGAVRLITVLMGVYNHLVNVLRSCYVIFPTLINRFPPTDEKFCSSS